MAASSARLVQTSGRTCIRSDAWPDGHTERRHLSFGVQDDRARICGIERMLEERALRDDQRSEEGHLL